jgi:uncharacterized membrane protein YkoI
MTLKCVVVTAAVALSSVTAGAQAPAAKAKPAAKVDLSKYPAPVRATIEAETKNATLKGVSKETEKGKTQYEVETIVNGKSRDLLVDPSGKVIEVEEQIAVDSAPPAVQDALKAKGTVLKLESVARDGVTTYEASIKGKCGKKTEVTLDAQGKPVKG